MTTMSASNPGTSRPPTGGIPRASSIRQLRQPEWDVAVPEARQQRRTGDVDHGGRGGYGHLRPGAHGGDQVAINEQDSVMDRRSTGRRIDRSADERNEPLAADDRTAVMRAAIATYESERETMAPYYEANSLSALSESYRHTALNELGSADLGRRVSSHVCRRTAVRDLRTGCRNYSISSRGRSGQNGFTLAIRGATISGADAPQVRLLKVSVQSDEPDHSSSNSDNRPALAADEQAEPDRGRADAHHRDVGIVAASRVFNRARGTRHTCGHVSCEAGRSNARSGRRRHGGGVGRSRRRVQRDLRSRAATIIDRALLCWKR
jgi:hypothetical protein